MAIHQDIVDGPSKWDLVLGLFDNTMSKPRGVKFTLDDGTTLEVVLDGVKRESGSGEDWCFEGWAPQPLDSLLLGPGEEWLRIVQGYFSTRRRKGHLHRFADGAEQRAFTGCAGLRRPV